ncbi:unnamed protein product [Rotaria magnacalcarata]|uniref:Uncharacterized protein n=3 Tax=Rotaria magnacalcarata TaxID=392030 RepID=A0A815Q8T8_9BILA|nr:unnamed protein product [Rotaria magnacalcarata]CAF2037062.1 unnamed protein product [Rotaria magnacalcarata]CAF2070464.1 unnamed protein product [Rotaria magnacalcarata]CAF4259432.1 unnamed protein product [Rotaria magnacalcarata]CAF4489620.1 unnamed protein product [Rotaria magnacalcarata]
MDYSTSDYSDVGAYINIAFPNNYKIPPLPKVLIKDIEDGILEKFGPHCANRQILIDAIIYDLLDQYNLLSRSFTFCVTNLYQKSPMLRIPDHFLR